MFSAYWPYMLLALLLLVLVTAVLLYLVLRRARRRAAAQDSKLAPVVVAPDAETPELRHSASALGLKSSFGRAVRLLRTHVTRRDYRYRLPWFLMVGESSSGKTTALSETGLSLPLGRPAEQLHGIRQGVNWFFFDRGVVLDVAGDLVLRPDGEPSNKRGWDQIARLLQKYRPERPIDGVVLTIPCTDLMPGRGVTLEARAKIEQKAACLYRKLWQAQKLLGMSFPVYVLVTKCDEMVGFRSLCRELPARARDEMFGWSSPYTLETAYRPEWVEEAFQNVLGYLFQTQVEVFAERDEVQDRDGLFLLPSEMQALKAPLQLYLDHIFKESSFHDSFFFRGLYFCGDADEDARPLLAAESSPVAPPVSDDWLEVSPDPFAQPAVAPEPQPSRRRPAFLKDLFDKKIFLEDMLARPVVKTTLSRNRTVLAAQVLSLAIPIIGCVGLLFTYASIERHRDELYNLLKLEEKDLLEVKALRGRRSIAPPSASDFYAGSEYQPTSYEAARPLYEGARPADERPGEVRTEESRPYGVRPDEARPDEARPRPALDARGEEWPRRAAYPPRASAYGVAAQGEAPHGAGGVDSVTYDNEHNLLVAMSKINARYFYSAFIPSSWFSDLDDEVRGSLVAAFQFVILDGLRLELEQHTENFLKASPIYSHYSQDPLDARLGGAANQPAAPRGAHPVYDQPFTAGADATLHGFIERFGELRVNRARYEGLTTRGSGSLEELKALSDYLGHIWPQEGFDSGNRLYRHALEQARGVPLKPAAAEVQQRFAARVAEMVEVLYERSFERRSGGVSYDYVGDIARAEALLSRPEYTWLATYVFEPRSPLHDMTLSSGLNELRGALESLQGEGFMAREGGYGLHQRQPLLRRQLVWEAEHLRKAVALCADYERFAGERSAYSKNLDESVRQAAHAQLRANVAALVARAQRYEPAARTPGESAMRTSLAAEVRSFQQAQELLAQLLEATARLNLDVGLRQAVSAQASYLVGAVNREFEAGQFYAMARPDFSWWDGGKPVSYRAFDAEGPDDLAAYLAAQRRRIAYIARELASPVFAFLAAQNIPAQQIRADSRVNWDEILSELERYDNKQPGNSVAVLEEFIRAGMDRASVEDCDELVRGDASARDFFIQTRNYLRRQLYRQCAELARQKSYANSLRAAEDNLRSLETYREIEREFNRTLAGRFPFGDAPGGVPFSEADPEAVLAFFTKFDRKKFDAARDALGRNPQLGNAREEAGAFLDRLDEVRAFFGSYLDKRVGPFLDFNLQFRVNREMEAGAGQIIDWTFDAGRKKYRYHDQELSGRWVVGEPVRLTLRWANDSPSVPVAEDSQTLKVRDRLAVFEYRSRWSLLALMARQAAAGGDFKHGVDTEVYTLKFMIPTHSAGGKLYDSQSKDLRGELAEVFMRVSLVAPVTKEPLVLPSFPVRGPKIY